MVIGAGPAGLFTAISCTTAGRNVMILEKNDTPAKKLLLTGSGQCNLTNNDPPREMLKHYFEASRFLKPAIMAFDNTKLKEFFQDRGLEMTTRDNGKIFPATLSAKDVLEVLLGECEKQGIELRCNSRVTSVEHTENGLFKITTSDGEVRAAFLAITTGGKSYPHTGSSGEGYFLARQLGHTIQEPTPALAALYTDDPLGDLAGISVKEVSVSLWRDGKKLAQRSGDLLFTHLGLSGPVILHLSRDVLPGDLIKLNLSGWKGEEGEKILLNMLKSGGKKNLKNILHTLNLPERLIEKLLELSHTEARTGSDIRKEERKELLRLLTEMDFSVSKTEGFSMAMLTRGGVSLSQVNSKSMESKLVSGLYFAGEVLDFDGESGGYNLQAAFSTGYLAGVSIKRKSAR